MSFLQVHAHKMDINKLVNPFVIVLYYVKLPPIYCYFYEDNDGTRESHKLELLTLRDSHIAMYKAKINFNFKLYTFAL